MVKVNLAEVEDTGFDDPTAGKYHVLITDGDVRQTGETSKHPDTDYWNIEFTVQDGKYEGRKMWTNVMLPPYQVFTLKNMLRASGKVDEDALDANEFDVELFPEDADDGDTPALLDGEWHFIVKWGKAKKPNPKTGEKGMEIKSFYAYDEDEWVAEDDEDDLLP